MITQALLTVAQMPLFVGVGGTTTGPRVAELAMVAEMQGAAGVVINAPLGGNHRNHHVMRSTFRSSPPLPKMTKSLNANHRRRRHHQRRGGRTNRRWSLQHSRAPSEIPIWLPEAARGTYSRHRRRAVITWTPPSAQQMQSQMMAKYRGEA